MTEQRIEAVGWVTRWTDRWILTYPVGATVEVSVLDDSAPDDPPLRRWTRSPEREAEL